MSYTDSFTLVLFQNNELNMMKISKTYIECSS